VKHGNAVDPVKLFQEVAGFYVKFDDEPNVPDDIKSWNVSVEQVSRTKAHVAATAQSSIWRKIDQFITSKKASRFPAVYSS
jgi:hypothetical protein